MGKGSSIQQPLLLTILLTQQVYYNTLKDLASKENPILTAIQEPEILDMRSERFSELKISADSLALPKDFLGQKGTKDYKLKDPFLKSGGYNMSGVEFSNSRMNKAQYIILKYNNILSYAEQAKWVVINKGSTYNNHCVQHINVAGPTDTTPDLMRQKIVELLSVDILHQMNIYETLQGVSHPRRDEFNKEV